MTRPPMPLRLALVVLVAVCLALAGCAHVGDDERPPHATSSAAMPIDTPWPKADPQRPVVDLAFTMNSELTSATGTESVQFTPDQEICEVVFRAWPNGPTGNANGHELTVQSLSVDERPLDIRYEAGGASEGSPGTIVSAGLSPCSPAGQRITVDLTFAVSLGLEADDRLGYSSEHRVAWLGTAYPLLSWVRGSGWDRSPSVRVFGESTTSETFRLNSLSVTAPSADAVAGLGVSKGVTADEAAGTTRHEFSAEAVRDVTFTVGRLNFVAREMEGTRVYMAMYDQATASAQEWLGETESILRDFRRLFGPVPYPELWISVLPHVGDGIEYPGALQMSDVDPHSERWLLAHEIAHQWLYGLVGNNQGQNPWLDEAFATYAQEVIVPTQLSESDPGEYLGYPGQVGRSMAWWSEQGRGASRLYVATVYRRGGRTLIQARQASGEVAFDAAVREYLRANAHSIAAPTDLASSLEGLDAATRSLQAEGALPGS